MLVLLAAVAATVLPQPRPVPMSRPAETAQSWSCQPRKTCGAIGSCEEAMWYLANCPWGGRLDRDNDGSPCETLCGSGN